MVYDALRTVTILFEGSTSPGSHGNAQCWGLGPLRGSCMCPADINCSGAVNSQDFFDFLAAFFASAPVADFNNDGATNTLDVFDFLAAFFAGC